MAPMAAAALFATGRRSVGRQAGEQPERVLVAALADNLDGGELVFVAAFVAGQDDRGARLGEGALARDASCSLAKARFDASAARWPGAI